MAHQHRKFSTRTQCFTGPVGRYENRPAHGGVTHTYTCKCGAVRHVNVNGCHVENGNWYMPAKEESCTR